MLARIWRGNLPRVGVQLYRKTRLLYYYGRTPTSLLANEVYSKPQRPTGG